MVTLLLALSLGTSVQEPAPAGDVPAAGVEAVASQPETLPVSSVTTQGLPRRAPHPRTLHAYWPVFGIFALTWLGITAYMLSFGPRLKRVAESMRAAGRAGAE